MLHSVILNVALFLLTAFIFSIAFSFCWKIDMSYYHPVKVRVSLAQFAVHWRSADAPGVYMTDRAVQSLSRFCPVINKFIMT